MAKQIYLIGAAAGIAMLGAGGTVAYNLATPAFAATELELHPPGLKWSHGGIIDVFDHASIRRGYFVYKQVCSACHSLQFVRYRHMIDVCFTEEEVKAEAAEIMVTDGPDDEGEMFEREGTKNDFFPSPYQNEQKARLANNGALPPDMSYLVYARHGAEDYVFHLLTGYCDPPAGIKLEENQHYNPYFVGGAIGMAPPLYNEIIEYDDGTPATTSQLAKDVVTFLTWCADPTLDQRKRYGYKAIALFAFLTGVSYYWKRRYWSIFKTQKLAYKARKMPKKF